MFHAVVLEIAIIPVMLQQELQQQKREVQTLLIKEIPIEFPTRNALHVDHRITMVIVKNVVILMLIKDG